MRTHRSLLSCAALVSVSLLTGPAVVAQARMVEPARPTTAIGAVYPVKLLTIFEENHSFSQERHRMPYLWHLAQRFGYASNYHAITHPSLPNYLAITGGSTFAIGDDRNPAAHHIRGKSIYSQALRSNKTARAYAESMPSRCRLTDARRYAVRHNPWTYYVSSRRACRTFDTSTRRFLRDARTNNLPVVGTLTPNLNHDAHNGTLKRADNYLRVVMPPILASRDFRSGRLAVVITTDESSGNAYGNRVLTVLCDINLHGTVVATRLDHYALSRFYSATVGAPPLRKAVYANRMRAAFGL